MGNGEWGIVDASRPERYSLIILNLILIAIGRKMRTEKTHAPGRKVCKVLKDFFAIFAA
jgi:hypothetical protein